MVAASGEKRRPPEAPNPASTVPDGDTAAANPPLLATPGGVSNCQADDVGDR